MLSHVYFLYTCTLRVCVCVFVCLCVCSDTICDLGGGSELANYGEYSGAPSESQTFEYAKTVLGLMTKEKHPDGEVYTVSMPVTDMCV